MKIIDDTTTHDETIRAEARLLRNLVDKSRRRTRALRLSRLRSKHRLPDGRRVTEPAS
jgi:hypothetical protein